MMETEERNVGECVSMASREELLEQYEEAQFALLMDKILELQGEEAIRKNEELKRDPAAAVPREVDERSISTINETFDALERQKKSRNLRRALRTLVIAAAVAVLLFTTVSADFRMAAKNFVYELTELAAELMFDYGDDSAEESKGEVIMGYYIPALPKDFELMDKGENAYSMWRQYHCENGFVMIRVVEDDGNGLKYHTDAEDIDAMYERINQFEVLIFEESDRIQFVLSDKKNEKYIEITSTAFSMEDLRKYVSGIKNN